MTFNEILTLKDGMVYWESVMGESVRMVVNGQPIIKIASSPDKYSYVIWSAIDNKGEVYTNRASNKYKYYGLSFNEKTSKIVDYSTPPIDHKFNGNQ